MVVSAIPVVAAVWQATAAREDLDPRSLVVGAAADHEGMAGAEVPTTTALVPDAKAGAVAVAVQFPTVKMLPVAQLQGLAATTAVAMVALVAPLSLLRVGMMAAMVVVAEEVHPGATVAFTRVTAAMGDMAAVAAVADIPEETEATAAQSVAAAVRAPSLILVMPAMAVLAAAAAATVRTVTLAREGPLQATAARTPAAAVRAWGVPSSTMLAPSRSITVLSAEISWFEVLGETPPYYATKARQNVVVMREAQSFPLTVR